MYDDIVVESYSRCMMMRGDALRRQRTRWRSESLSSSSHSDNRLMKKIQSLQAVLSYLFLVLWVKG